VAQALVEQLARELEARLGGNLVGVYLHGSLAPGCFNPERSDIDLLVVTRRRLRHDERRPVAELALSRSNAPHPLVLTVVSEGDVRPWRYPTLYDFHYGESLRARVEEQLADGEIREADDTDFDLAGTSASSSRAGGRSSGAPPTTSCVQTAAVRLPGF
jgi:predicted nucleotidyltransferase